jgi:amidohydrolase
MIAEITNGVDHWMPRLADVSNQIHSRPELCFEEHFAHDLLCSTLEAAGCEVHRKAFGTETGFVCDMGEKNAPTVAILLEYDALPGIGHGCGHNVIAAAGLGAGLALKEVVNDLGVKVRIMGTPAEEGGGGKIVMARNGAFEGVVAAMMIHPADRDLLRMNAIAIQELKVSYTGRAAHAASAPHEGRNALDAAVLGYNTIAAMRQHIRDTERVHGVITHGGDKPNVVPAYAETLWYVRSDTLETLQPLRARVSNALESAARACECESNLVWQDYAYADMVDDSTLSDLCQEIGHSMGRTLAEPSASARVVGSTDMGNISYLTPSIHPMLAIADPGTALHTTDFAAAAVGGRAETGIRDGAIMMANIVARIGSDQELTRTLQSRAQSMEIPPNLL